MLLVHDGRTTVAAPSARVLLGERSNIECHHKVNVMLEMPEHGCLRGEGALRDAG